MIAMDPGTPRFLTDFPYIGIVELGKEGSQVNHCGLDPFETAPLFKRYNMTEHALTHEDAELRSQHSSPRRRRRHDLRRTKERHSAQIRGGCSPGLSKLKHSIINSQVSLHPPLA